MVPDVCIRAMPVPVRVLLGPVIVSVINPWLIRCVSGCVGGQERSQLVGGNITSVDLRQLEGGAQYDIQVMALVQNREGPPVSVKVTTGPSAYIMSTCTAADVVTGMIVTMRVCFRAGVRGTTAGSACRRVRSGITAYSLESGERCRGIQDLLELLRR